MKTFKLILDNQNNQENYNEDGSTNGTTINNHYKCKILEDVKNIGYLNLQISFNVEKIDESNKELVDNFMNFIKNKYSEFTNSLSATGFKMSSLTDSL